MTNKERQRRYRERLAAEGRKPLTVFVTDDERFFVERLLAHLKENPQDKPALMRRPNGTLTILDI